jgi:hypothetical protein
LTASSEIDLGGLPDSAKSAYTEAEIEEGLTAVAFCSGNTRRAARELQATGTRAIPRDTLNNWVRGKHRARYERIVEEILPTIYAGIAQRSEDLATRMAEVEEELLERVKARADELKPHEAASSLRNVTVAKAVNIDKAGLIRGRPTEIGEERTLVEVARALERFEGIVKINTEVLEGTAEEVEEAAAAEDQDAEPGAPEGSG